MKTLDDALEYARTHKFRDSDGRLMSWNNYCESFVSRASGTPYRSSALLASQASTIVSTSIDTAPAGSFGFSRGVIIDGVDYGHVWINMGDGQALMASKAVDVRLAGGDAGLINIHRYLSRFPNQRVIGWSYDHCGGRFDVATVPPAVAAKPALIRFDKEAFLNKFKREEDGMQLFITQDNRSGKHEQQELAFSPILGVFDPYTGTGLSTAVAHRATGQTENGDVWVVSNEEVDMLRNLAERTRTILRSRLEL